MNWNGFWSYSASSTGRRVFVIVLFLVVSSHSLRGQTGPDSVFVSQTDGTESFLSESELDPNKSALFSAVLPGLGQAYNNQYWKIPIIYGGAIIIGHYINYNHRIYNEFRNTLIAEIDNDPNTENPYRNRFQRTSLTRNADQFRRNRDLLIVVGGVFYLLNIVDAHVSAHLHEFEINDKLSMKISPSIQSTPLFSRAAGLSVSLRLH